MNPASLANLNQGNIRHRVSEKAGREKIIQAIIAALSPGATDDAIRQAAGKVFDFEVTPEYRAEYLRGRAERVYDVFTRRIVQTVSGSGSVSLGGFGAFSAVRGVESVEVAMEGGPVGNMLFPILATEQRHVEKRAAVIGADVWQGGPLGPFRGLDYAPGVVSEIDAATGQSVIIDGSVVIRRASGFGVKTTVKINCEGSDGINRDYQVGGVDLWLALVRSWEPAANGVDKTMVFTMAGDQRAKVGAGRVCVEDWEIINSRRLADLSMRDVSIENFQGLPPSEIAKAFPREARFVRRFGNVCQLRRVGRDEFLLYFDWAQDSFREQGIWPLLPQPPSRRVLFKPHREFLSLITPNQK